MKTISDCGLRIAEIKRHCGMRGQKDIVECGLKEQKTSSFKSSIRNLPLEIAKQFQGHSPGNPADFTGQSQIRIGFTLLEVLISIAIVGLTLTVLIHSQLLSVRQGMKAKHHTTAVFLANEILSETFMREEPLLVIEGENFTDYPEFSWQREVEDSDIEGLKKIKITVSGPENTRIILNTYRLQSITVQTGTKK